MFTYSESSEVKCETDRNFLGSSTESVGKKQFIPLILFKTQTDGLKIDERRTSNVQHRMMNKKMKKRTYDLEERLLSFAVRIIKLVEHLPNTRTGNHVAGQLLRSGTSPYPNHGEAQAAESPKDFIHKLRISLKELREAQRWVRLIKKVSLLKNAEQLNKLLLET